uniref:Uncharacterized protein n=1 Tax=Rhizophora mucronata TaxID=61149 RepID=A0A2P2NG64_RHIMU
MSRQCCCYGAIRPILPWPPSLPLHGLGRAANPHIHVNPVRNCWQYSPTSSRTFPASASISRGSVVVVVAVVVVWGFVDSNPVRGEG